MSYPKFKNKHLEEAFFGANVIKEKDKTKNFPRKFVMIYSQEILK